MNTAATKTLTASELRAAHRTPDIGRCPMPDCGPCDNKRWERVADLVNAHIAKQVGLANAPIGPRFFVNPVPDDFWIPGPERLPTCDEILAAVKDYVHNGLFGSTKPEQIALVVSTLIESCRTPYTQMRQAQQRRRNSMWNSMLRDTMHPSDEALTLRARVKALEEQLERVTKDNRALDGAVKGWNKCFVDADRLRIETQAKNTALKADNERLNKAMSANKFLGVSFDAWRQAQSAMKAVTHTDDPAKWLDILSERHEAMKATLKREMRDLKRNLAEVTKQRDAAISGATYNSIKISRNTTLRDIAAMALFEANRNRHDRPFDGGIHPLNSGPDYLNFSRYYGAAVAKAVEEAGFVRHWAAFTQKTQEPKVVDATPKSTVVERPFDGKCVGHNEVLKAMRAIKMRPPVFSTRMNLARALTQILANQEPTPPKKRRKAKRKKT